MKKNTENQKIERKMDSIIPECMESEIGRVCNMSNIQVGVDCSVIKIESEKGKFILKIGDSERMGHECFVLNDLTKKEIGFSVPKFYSFFRKGKIAFLLEEYIEGDSLKDSFSVEKKMDLKMKKVMIEKSAKVLSKIHEVSFASIKSSHSMKELLKIAEKNYLDKLIDQDEFVGIGSPKEILLWLSNNIPKKLNWCLLHGDYRPKNLLWLENKITAVIDWEHALIGDPYYDLAVFDYYLKTKEEKKFFWLAYDCKKNVDLQKLNFFDYLSKFLNV